MFADVRMRLKRPLALGIDAQRAGIDAQRGLGIDTQPIPILNPTNNKQTILDTSKSHGTALKPAPLVWSGGAVMKAIQGRLA